MSEARAGRQAEGVWGTTVPQADEWGAKAPQAQGRVGSVINGKWQIDARIGSGGMATVYAATHRNGHRAALKMLHTVLSRDPSTRARFLREGYVANAVGHPGVVGVLDDGVAEDGAAFLVLELLEGETIDARRNRLGGALPIDEALDLADQALDALSAAHGKGIVHRDVKPENVFFTKEGAIKLLDFGLARMKDAQAEATKTGVTIGTPEFMPPEQARGRRDAVDARSDLWGLGATLFTAITGRYVHEDAQSIHEQLVASATRRSRPIRQLAPHVSPAVAKVIDRALELEMADRWQSASDMQAALRAARGKHGQVFADSATVPAAAAPPFGQGRGGWGALQDRPVTESTMEMAAAPPHHAPPAQSRKMEDATDMEATFIEETQAAPIGALRMQMFRAPMQTPSDDHATNPTVVSPRSFPASTPPLLMTTSPMSFNPRQSVPPPPHSTGRLMSGPMSSPTSAPSARVQEPRSSTRAIIFVSLILIVVCAAMGAYVLWRGSAPTHP